MVVNMTEQEIQEGNKLIADFMGVKFDIHGEITGKHGVIVKGSRYHSSWDWLMPVVEKIEQILPDDSVVTIEYKDCYIPVLEDDDSFTIQGNGLTKIEAVYNAVVEFIKWYNIQK